MWISWRGRLVTPLMRLYRPPFLTSTMDLRTLGAPSRTRDLYRGRARSPPRLTPRERGSRSPSAAPRPCVFIPMVICGRLGSQYCPRSVKGIIHPLALFMKEFTMMSVSPWALWGAAWEWIADRIRVGREGKKGREPRACSTHPSLARQRE